MGASIQTESIMFQPSPLGHPPIRCRIVRRRTGAGSLYPEYELFLEGTSESRFFLFAARRRKNARGSTYAISMNRIDSGQFDERIVGKVKSNFLGTLFSIYDAKTGWQRERHEQAAVLYQPNLLGLRGPRKFLLLLPGLTDDDKIRSLTYRPGRCQLHEKFSNDQDIRNIVVLRNKEPLWNDGKPGRHWLVPAHMLTYPDSQSYVLNFSDRVSQASVKNFQVVHHLDCTIGRALDGV